MSAVPPIAAPSGGKRERGASPRGVTTLMYACQQGDVEKVRRILRVQVSVLGKRRWSEAGQSEIINKQDKSGKTALHYCCTSDNKCAAQAADLLVMAASDLIESRDEDGFTPLHLAVIAGNMPLVTFLLANNADVNAVDSEKHTVVHWAAVCGETGALRAVLAAGAPVSTPDVHGGYPLHYAAQMCGGDKDSSLGLQVLQTLLQHRDIKVNVEDGDGRQPLLWAASAGSAKAVLALIRAGARVDAPDKDGLTALHCAASRGHTDCIDTLLTLCGMSPDVIDSNGCTALHYSVTLGHADATALLLTHGADPNRQDRKGRSPSHCGCAKGQFETVKMIGAHGANLWLKNARGDLPLHEAAASGRRELVKWLLESRPSQVNARNNDGRCPLHLAALNDNSDMCKILLDGGAQINPVLRTSKNVFMTPLDCALQRGFRSTAKYLQVHGGVPATRLTASKVKLPNGTANVHIREEMTFGETTDSEREGEEREERVKRKLHKKLSYRYERKKTISTEKEDDEVDAKNTSTEKERKRDKSARRRSSAEKGEKKSDKETKPKENITYSSEVKITNNYGGINIEKNGEIIISDGSPIIRTETKAPTQTKMETEINLPDIAKEASKVKLSESTKISIPEEIAHSDTNNNTKIKITKKTGDTPTKSADISENIEEIKSLANTIEQTAKSITEEVMQIQQNLDIDDTTKSKQQDQFSYTSAEESEHKELIVEAAVHQPPKIPAVSKEEPFLKEEKRILESAITKEVSSEKTEDQTEPTIKEEQKEEEEHGQKEVFIANVQETSNVVSDVENIKEDEMKDETKEEETMIEETTIADTVEKEEVDEIETDQLEQEIEKEEEKEEEEKGGEEKEEEEKEEEKQGEEEKEEEEKEKGEKEEDKREDEEKQEGEKEDVEEETEENGKQPGEIITVSEDIEITLTTETKEEEEIREKEVGSDEVEKQKLELTETVTSKEDASDISISTPDTVKYVERVSSIQEEPETIIIEPPQTPKEEEKVAEINGDVEDKREDAIKPAEETEKEVQVEAEGVTAVSVEAKGKPPGKSKKFLKDRKQKRIEETPKITPKQDKTKPIDSVRDKKVKVVKKDRVKREVAAKETLDKHKDHKIPKKAIEKVLEVTNGETQNGKIVKRRKEVVKIKTKRKTSRKSSEERMSDEEISTSSESDRRRKHKSFTILDDVKDEQDKKKSKIPTPVLNLGRDFSKSDRYLDRSVENGLDTRISLPNLPRQDELDNGISKIGTAYSDNDRSPSDLEEGSKNGRRRRLKKRMKRDSRSAGSDYESGNLIDSGFEPSPRSTKIPRWRNMSDRGVNMTSVTQTIQSNIRRYHLERKIFQHLLELKRLQIRSGQHNEAVLVKRAIDEYHNSCASTVGAGRYVPEDYSFKSFEKFLYHALRRLQKSDADHLRGLPEAPDNPLLCTQSTHRCLHATHAYTGIPCAAYLPQMDHHTIPKIGYPCKPQGFLPHIHPKKTVTLEVLHGNDKQVISLPTERLDQNKRYYVTFTVKGQEPTTPNGVQNKGEAAHRHAKSV